MTSGGSGDCTTGGTTFYQPINPLLSDFGLTLTTAGAETPAPQGNVAQNWAAGRVYEAGVTVTHAGVRYQCLQTHQAQGPWAPAGTAEIRTEAARQRRQQDPARPPFGFAQRRGGAESRCPCGRRLHPFECDRPLAGIMCRMPKAGAYSDRQTGSSTQRVALDFCERARRDHSANRFSCSCSSKRRARSQTLKLG